MFFTFFLHRIAVAHTTSKNYNLEANIPPACCLTPKIKPPFFQYVLPESHAAFFSRWIHHAPCVDGICWKQACQPSRWWSQHRLVSLEILPFQSNYHHNLQQQFLFRRTSLPPKFYDRNHRFKVRTGNLKHNCFSANCEKYRIGMIAHKDYSGSPDIVLRLRIPLDSMPGQILRAFILNVFKHLATSIPSSK